MNFSAQYIENALIIGYRDENNHHKQMAFLTSTGTHIEDAKAFIESQAPVMSQVLVDQGTAEVDRIEGEVSPE